MKALLLRLLTAILTPRVQLWGARVLLRFGPRTLSLGNRLFAFHWQDVIPQLVGRLVAEGILRAEGIRYAGPFPDQLIVTLKRSN